MSNTAKQLNIAHNAYQQGNFALIRRTLHKLEADSSLSEKERSTVQKIQSKIAIDPITSVGFGVTFFVLLFLTIKYIL